MRGMVTRGSDQSSRYVLYHLIAAINLEQSAWGGMGIRTHHLLNENDVSENIISELQKLWCRANKQQWDVLHSERVHTGRYRCFTDCLLETITSPHTLDRVKKGKQRA